MVQAPIWHVNGDDPEACVRVARLAFEFRQRFKKDVVIDMWCYRKWGHNEGDDPSFTQPLMYERIRNLRTIRKRYVESLVNRGDLTVEEAEEALAEFKRRLDRAFDEIPRQERQVPPKVERQEPAPVRAKPVETKVDRATLQSILDAITEVPEGFPIHPKLEKGLEQRRGQLEEDAVDWSTAEALAFGTLLREGRTVRLSGQDSRRGTFSQRHSVLVDQETGREYTPLTSVENGGGRFFIYDSLLSEFAVMGFEYGYSVGSPDALVLWEAQFGDFLNEAQVVVDLMVAAGEDKWGQPNGLVLLLPHGFEGQGPEHSSARLECSGPGQAHGLCFSVPHGVTPPPSLVRIHKELHTDLGMERPNHGSLEPWTRQGILLLNTTLTVREGAPRSHEGVGWETFTDAVIRVVAKQSDPVFLLWGKKAQRKEALITRITGSPGKVVKSSHPSPPAAYRPCLDSPPFVGSKPFSKANDLLGRVAKGEIDWSLSL